MSVKVKNRMAFIESNEEMREAILESFKKRRVREDAPCPCLDCEGTLRKKEVSYTNTDNEPWTIVRIPILFCKCGFQARDPEEARS